MSDTIILDTDELMHLALHATHQNQPDKAIIYLKRILQQNNGHAQSWYLLGALHAEIGMYDRAIEEMQHAISIGGDTLPATAGFQLGLLYLTSGRLEEAEKAWVFLDSLGEDNPLFLFKRGMQHLIKDEFQACIDDLSRGISLNDLNEDLNNDMRHLIQTVSNNLDNTSADTGSHTTESDDTKPQKGQNILLSAYQQQNYDDD